MRGFAPLPVGTRIIAARDFGPIIKGQPGIVTGRVRGRWLRAAYACTFLGTIRVTAQRRRITACEHGYHSQMLEDPLWFMHTRQAVATAGQQSAVPTRPTD